MRFFDSRRQAFCVWLGFAFLLALTMFPPWIEYQIISTQPQAVVTRLWHAPADSRGPKIDEPDLGFIFVDVDYRRMLTEIAVGECFVLALFLTWGRTRDERKG